MRTVAPVTFGITFAPHTLIVELLWQLLVTSHLDCMQQTFRAKCRCSISVPYIHCDINVLSKEKKCIVSAHALFHASMWVHLLCPNNPSFLQYTFWCTKQSQFFSHAFRCVVTFSHGNILT